MKKCPYFKADCVEGQCGIWDMKLECCSMVSIAMGNWSLRSFFFSIRDKESQPIFARRFGRAFRWALVESAVVAILSATIYNIVVDKDYASAIAEGMFIFPIFFWGAYEDFKNFKSAKSGVNQ